MKARVDEDEKIRADGFIPRGSNPSVAEDVWRRHLPSLM